MTMDRIGQQLGNYRITRVLGQGGFADVYLGEHIYLKRPAALKLLRTSLKESDIENFLTEAQTLASLNHPYIVRVLEYVVEQGMPVLIMDYAQAGTIRNRHPRSSVLPLKTVITYSKQIAIALQYAHNHNIIHRDVKPENMLLGPQEQILLSDFGLALLTSSPEFLSSQKTVGTIAYMAPEQIRGKPTFASDQYALAVVAYEWLCGKRPFEGKYFELARQHFYAAPPSLHDHVPTVPTMVEEVILRALAKDPRDRFISIQAFAYALERAGQISAREDHDHDFQQTTPLTQKTTSCQEVYLVAAPADEIFAARLKVDLEQRGVVFWHASSEKTPDNADEGIRQAIRAVDMLLLVVSPSTRASRTIKEYLRIASIYERPLLFVWAAGNDLAEVLPDAWGKAPVIDLIDARQSRYTSALEKMAAYLGGERFITATLETDHLEPQGEPRNPYKGLQAFTERDTNDFFGRDILVQQLAEALKSILHPVWTNGPRLPDGSPTDGRRDTSPTGRLLPVIGASGSGKSSVVMAGLLPLLQGGALPDSAAWLYLSPMVPGKRPVEALTLALAPQMPARSLASIGEDLADGSARGLHLLATQLLPYPKARVVLLVDQFEELFAQNISEEERRRFIDLLVTAATEPQGPVIVILTLRIDFYGHLVNYPELYRLVETNAKTVLPMDIQDLRAVIEQPAALPDVQLSFEGNLVGDLLFEAHGQAGVLPLLEFTLDQLFQQRNGHHLTLAAYKQIGGVKGALAKQAETTYASLPSEEHRRLARALFLRLIDPGLSEQDIRRRRASFSELSLPDAKQTAIIRDVTDAFITARLLTTNEIAGLTTVEVSHEALIREWARLADWIREGREDIHFQQTLSEDATEWEQRSRPGDRLYRGSQLREANVWARRNTPSSHEQAFLHASATHRLRSLLSVLAALLLVISSIGTAGWFLTHQTHQAPKLPDPTHVTTLEDDGIGSLRWAIANAPSGSTITFDQSLRGTILLPSSSNDRAMLISRNLTIRGPGAGVLSISAGHTASRIFYVSKGVLVTISNLTIKDSGGVGGSYPLGGGIKNEGTLTLSNSIISGNTDIQGGGIDNEGTLTLMNSIVSGNSSSNLYASGGGIVNGIFNAQARATLIDSTISGNTALADDPNGTGYGGGIENAGILTLINSTVSNNSASTSAGGILNSGTLTLINSTVSGNSASHNGGGILIRSITGEQSPLIAQTNLTFATIYGNRASIGADIAVEDGSYSQGAFKPSKQVSQVQIRNSIVANSSAHHGSDIAGTFITAGYNLFQDTSGATFDDPNNKHTTDLAGANFPDLGIDPQLKGNGGPTQTLALLPGSPAIDAIPPAACMVSMNGTAITTDQRGVKRPQGRGCDIGAYERVG